MPSFFTSRAPAASIQETQEELASVPSASSQWLKASGMVEGEAMTREVVQPTDVGRRKNPKQQRAVATTEAILQATRQIISKEGFQKATTNRIAELAGVSVGSLYQYFPNKQAIVRTLIQESVSGAASHVRTELRDLMDVPLQTALRKIMAMLVKIYKENDFILFRVLEQVPELRDFTENLKIEIYTYSTNLAFLEQHRADIRRDDLHTALLLVERAVIANIECYLANNPTGISEETLIDELTTMTYTYLTDEKV